MAYYLTRRRRNSERNRGDESPGHDAFLDIVANLVGILIILVVVVSAHAGASLARASTGDQPLANLEELERELKKAKDTAHGLHYNNQSLRASISDENKLLKSLKLNRQGMLIELTELENAVATNESKLEKREKENLKKRQRLIDLELELNRARAEYAAVEADQKSLTETIVHYPTPVAKTVFSDEAHFRIMQGRVVAVPVDELVNKMRAEWRLKSEKLQTAARTVETVGPIDRFRLQYTLEAEELQTPTQLGMISERKIAFRRFVLLPVSDRIGEPADDALNENSEFARRISQLTPGKTTISIWVYPDSYPEFNRVKLFLQKAGFQTAVWPLPSGRLISGGPDGYRSSAQ